MRWSGMLIKAEKNKNEQKMYRFLCAFDKILKMVR